MTIASTIQQTASDELAKLLQFSWRGNRFPAQNITVDISQDLAVHKYPNIDSAKVESMGRNPYIITATCVFTNGLNLGRLESWDSNNLYPGVYTQFLIDMTNNNIGELIHPFLGPIKCKPINVKPNIVSTFRGGEIVTAQWIETLDEDIVSSVSNISSPYTNAATLDNILTSIVPDPTSLGLIQGITSFTDMVNSLQAIIDTADLNLKKALGFIASINYKVQSFLDSVNRLLNDATQLSNPENYRNEIVKISRGVYNAGDNAVNNAKTIKQGSQNVIGNTNNNAQAFNIAPSKADLIKQYNVAKANPRTSSGELSAMLLKIQNISLFSSNSYIVNKEQLAKQTLDARLGASKLSGNTIWLLSQAINTATLLQANLIVLQQQIGNKFNQQVGIYQVPAITTMSSISIEVMNDISDLITLNPLLNTSYIKTGTKVIYFK